MCVYVCVCVCVCVWEGVLNERHVTHTAGGGTLKELTRKRIERKGKENTQDGWIGGKGGTKRQEEK